MTMTRHDNLTGLPLCDECSCLCLEDEYLQNRGICDACFLESEIEKAHDLEPAGFNGGDGAED